MFPPRYNHQAMQTQVSRRRCRPPYGFVRVQLPYDSGKPKAGTIAFAGATGPEQIGSRSRGIAWKDDLQRCRPLPAIGNDRRAGDTALSAACEIFRTVPYGTEKEQADRAISTG